MAAARTRLFLVRHGQATANVGQRYLGSRDDPLTELGQTQALQLAAALRELPISVVYSSPLQRALQTAEPIAAAHELAPQQEARLREGSFGSWEGLSHAEVLARSVEDRELMQRWQLDPECAPPAGESLASVQRRVLEVLAELEQRHSGESLVLVSHVLPIKALICAALQVSLQSARHMFLDNATISVVDWGVHPVLRLFNAHEHLGVAKWLSS